VIPKEPTKRWFLFGVSKRANASYHRNIQTCAKHIGRNFLTFELAANTSAVKLPLHTSRKIHADELR
jgi:hypothetical protein